MTAEQVEENAAKAVGNVLGMGLWPAGVRVSFASYRTLVARDGLERRNVSRGAADTLFARVHGFELPVDADIQIADDNALALGINPPSRRH